MLYTRRKFVRSLFSSGVAVGTGGAGAYGTLVEPRKVQVTRVRIPVAGLPRAFHGLKIAHLTDLHRGRAVSAEYLERCVDLANAEQPDLFVFTGDFVTHTRRMVELDEFLTGQSGLADRYLTDIRKFASRARARYGVFSCLGNHDHWFDALAITKSLESAGAAVLRNNNVTVKVGGESLPIVGVGDLWTEGVDMHRSFKSLDERFSLVLMHNPDTFEKWPRPGSHLILSGHTHGGQINLPLVGPPIVPSRYGRKYAKGLFTRGDTAMYVNRGVGVVTPPLRLHCPPEIAVFYLQASEIVA